MSTWAISWILIFIRLAATVLRLTIIRTSMRLEHPIGRRICLW